MERLAMALLIRIFFLAAGLTVPGMALAHPGPHPDGAFATGFVHPLVGFDHLLAMACVGLWAVQLGGRCRLIVPAAFVISMGAGAVLGVAGVPLPLVEAGIGLSVFALGLLVALAAHVAWPGAVAAVSLFAVFHGYAHGTEIPPFSAHWSYFSGFLTATALLHGSGVMLGILLGRTQVVRATGAAIGLAGLWLVLST
jgi:urease accessory protein